MTAIPPSHVLRHLSPLRYPGGKARFLCFIQDLIVDSGLFGCHYAEPYAGGAGLGLGLLRSGYASQVHINDIDRSIYAFWYSTLHYTDALCKLIQTCPLTIEFWKEQREIQRAKKTARLLELGFSTFYLNRTNRSGIIWGGGPIGGLEQKGEWRLDARFYRMSLIRRIKSTAQLRSKIRVHNLDAVDFIAKMAGSLPRRTFTYLDPPYYVRGQQKLYANYYRARDHIEIVEALESCPWPWVVSYDAVPEILRLYHSKRRMIYDIGYSASSCYQGREAMFFSGDLTIPASRTPLAIRPVA